MNLFSYERLQTKPHFDNEAKCLNIMQLDLRYLCEDHLLIIGYFNCAMQAQALRQTHETYMYICDASRGKAI